MNEKDIVLVVDDNPMSRVLPSLILRPFGLLVHECSNVLEMTDFLAKHATKTIILDINMPHINGYQALKIVRSNPSCHDTRIYAYTALRDGSDERKLLDAGFDGIIAKPMTSKSLTHALQIDWISTKLNHSPHLNDADRPPIHPD